MATPLLCQLLLQKTKALPHHRESAKPSAERGVRGVNLLEPSMDYLVVFGLVNVTTSKLYDEGPIEEVVIVSSEHSGVLSNKR
jgi:hypothetical protein